MWQNHFFFLLKNIKNFKYLVLFSFNSQTKKSHGFPPELPEYPQDKKQKKLSDTQVSLLGKLISMMEKPVSLLEKPVSLMEKPVTQIEKPVSQMKRPAISFFTKNMESLRAKSQGIGRKTIQKK